MYLFEENAVFGAIWRRFESFAENRESRLFVRISTDNYQAQSIDERLASSINGKAIYDLMIKLEDCKFHKSSNNYILSP